MAHSERVHAIDWGYSLLLFLLIPYHTALIYTVSYEGFFIKADVLSPAYDHLTLIIYPLFSLVFAVSGHVLFYSLRKRSAGEFIRERVTRLLVPLIVGTIVFLPLMVSFAIAHRSPTGFTDVNYWRVMRNLLRLRDHPIFPRMVTYPTHLWFLAVLFLLEMVSLPIARWSEAGSPRRIEGIARFSIRYPVAAFLMYGGVVWLDHLLQTMNVVYLIFYFAVGYLFASCQQLMDVLHKRMWLFGVLTLISLPVYIFTVVTPGISDNLRAVAQSFINPSLTLTVAAIFVKYLNHPHRLTDYLRPLAFFMYLVHMPVIVVVGYFALRWPVSQIIQYGATCGLTMVTVVILYEVFRRLGPVTIMLGAKRSKQITA